MKIKIIISLVIVFSFSISVSAQSEKEKRIKENRQIMSLPAKQTATNFTEQQPNNLDIANSIDRKDLVKPPLTSHDTLTLPEKTWSKADQLNTQLQSYAARETQLNKLNGIGYQRAGTMALSKSSDVYGINLLDEHPDMLTTRSGALGLSYNIENWSIQVETEINRYMTAFQTIASDGSLSNRVFNQFGVSGALTYFFSPQVSATIFGSYYNKNPYFYMGAFPFVNTSRYGGYLWISKGKIGMKLGMERYYDSFQCRWYMQPIVTPVLHISKHFDMELPVGSLFREGADQILHHHKGGPMIMPEGFH